MFRQFVVKRSAIFELDFDAKQTRSEQADDTSRSLPKRIDPF